MCTVYMWNWNHKLTLTKINTTQYCAIESGFCLHLTCRRIEPCFHLHCSWREQLPQRTRGQQTPLASRGDCEHRTCPGCTGTSPAEAVWRRIYTQNDNHVLQNTSLSTVEHAVHARRGLTIWCYLLKKESDLCHCLRDYIISMVVGEVSLFQR